MVLYYSFPLSLITPLFTQMTKQPLFYLSIETCKYPSLNGPKNWYSFRLVHFIF